MVGFSALFGALLLQRLEEVGRARRHTAELFRLGAKEHATRHYPAMIALHTLWFLCWWIESPPRWNFAWLPLALAGQLLRGWAQQTLGARWTTRVLTVPGEQPVRHGPFRFLRHPNYAGVCCELAAWPLLTGAPCTAVVFTLANAALLGWRIRCEEAAWIQSGS